MKVPPEKEVCQGDVSNDTFLGMNSGKSAAGDGSGGAFASGGLGFSYSDAQVVVEVVPQPHGRRAPGGARLLTGESSKSARIDVNDGCRGLLAYIIRNCM